MGSKENESLYDEIKNGFFDLIPVKALKDFKPIPKFILTLIIYLVFLAAFLYTFIINVIEGLEDTFVSLKESSGNCEPVPLAVRDSFLISSDGYYKGQNDFHYSRSMYQLALNFYRGDENEYATMIDTFRTQYFDYYGSRMVGNSYEYNLLVWLASESFYVDRYGSKQALSLQGDVSSLFDASSSKSAIGKLMSSKNETDPECTVTPDIFFDSSTTSSSVTVSFNGTQLNQDCSSLLTLNYGDDTYEFQISFSTLISILSYNYEILTMDSLDQISNTVYSFENKYPTSKFSIYDNKVAYTILSAGTTSFISTYMVPIFGINTDGYDCSCANAYATDTYDNYCNYPSFYTAMLLFPNATSMTTVFSRYETQVQGTNTTIGRKLNEDVLSYLNHQYGSQSSTLSPSITLYDICQSTCDIIRVSYQSNPTFDDTNGSIITSFYTYGYTTTQFACKNSISILPGAYERASVAPIKLTQDYFQCTHTLYDVVVDAYGISVGVVASIPVICILILFPIIYILLMCCGKDPKKILENPVTDRQRKQTIAKLAEKLTKLDGEEDISIEDILEPFTHKNKHSNQSKEGNHDQKNGSDSSNNNNNGNIEKKPSIKKVSVQQSKKSKQVIYAESDLDEENSPF